MNNKKITIGVSSSNNYAIFFADTIVKIIALVAIISLMVNGYPFIYACLLMLTYVIANIMKSICTDKIYQINDELYFHRAFSGKKDIKIDIETMLKARDAFTMTWDIDGEQCVSDIPPMFKR